MNTAVCNQKPSVHSYLTQNLLKHFQRNIPWSQYYRNILCKIYNRRFQADTNLSSIQDHINGISQIFLHMLSSGRTWTARCVCARSRNKASRRPDKLLSDQITGKPDCNAVKTAGRLPGNNLCFWKNHGQRPRPEFLCQKLCLFRNFRHNLFQAVHICNVNDQRIV